MVGSDTDRQRSFNSRIFQSNFLSLPLISFIIPMEQGRYKGNFLFGIFRYWKIFAIFDPTFGSVNANLKLSWRFRSNRVSKVEFVIF